MVSNIVENAIRFANENSIIDVSFEDTGDKLIVTIKDEGVPIPQQELETIFDAFVQSSKTKTGAGGTGLGFSICKQIIEDHDGKSWAREDLKGSAINFFSQRRYEGQVRNSFN